MRTGGFEGFRAKSEAFGQAFALAGKPRDTSQKPVQQKEWQPNSWASTSLGLIEVVYTSVYVGNCSAILLLKNGPTRS